MTIWKDVAYAIRRLAARRGFLALALLTLTLGIGVNATIFTFVNGFLVRPLPVAEPNRLATLGFHRDLSNSVSYPDYLDIRDRNQVFSSVTALRVMPMALSFSNFEQAGANREKPTGSE